MPRCVRSRNECGRALECRGALRGRTSDLKIHFDRDVTRDADCFVVQTRSECLSDRLADRRTLPALLLLVGLLALRRWQQLGRGRRGWLGCSTGCRLGRRLCRRHRCRHGCRLRGWHRCLGCWHWRSASRGAHLDARRAGRPTLLLLKCVRLSLLRHAHTAPAQEKVGRGRVIPHSVLQRAQHKRWIEAEALEL